MIRLPPTLIVLGQSDLRDFDKRSRQRTVETYFDRLSLSSSNTETPETAHELKGVTIRRQPSPRKKQTTAPSPEKSKAPESPESFVNLESPPPSPKKKDKSSSDEHGFVSVERHVSPENEDSQSTPRSPVKEDDFHYGGFVESPGNSTSSHRSSPFAPDPDDASTPQPTERHLSRLRVPLPRSPLYLSQNMSASPERRPTCALTPRVMSRVATLGTPGILFSEPARRPARRGGRSPRTLRHQTNSFSFDESERSSVAYEQERTASGSIDQSTSRPFGEVALHEELRGISMGSSLTGPNRTGNPMANTTEEANFRSLPQYNSHNDFIFSSPALDQSDDDEEDEEDEESDDGDDGDEPSSSILTLPPPFSSSPRNASNTGALPGTVFNIQHPRTSPLRADSSTFVNHHSEERSPSPSPGLMTSREVSSTHQSSRNLTPTGFISRIVATVRSHSPLNRRTSSARHSQSSPSSASPTPRRERPAGSSPRGSQSQTPRDYRVYNDDLSPAAQPQTPDHLPEARHRSRFHPAWTAPVGGRSRSTSRQLISNNDGIDEPVERPPATPSRRRRVPGRSPSPTGLTSSGFLGLYGGRENGDDEQSWVDGVRFDNAEVRLWGSRDERNSERDLNNTPEREDWRANLR